MIMNFHIFSKTSITTKGQQGSLALLHCGENSISITYQWFDLIYSLIYNNWQELLFLARVRIQQVQDTTDT